MNHTLGLQLQRENQACEAASVLFGLKLHLRSDESGHSQREKLSESKWTPCKQAGLSQYIPLTPQRIMKNDVFTLKSGSSAGMEMSQF